MSPRQDTAEALSYIGGQAAALRAHVSTASTPGNLDGLLAAHVLGHPADITRRVSPFRGAWLDDHAHRLHEPGTLAAIGYGFAVNASEVTADLRQRVCVGLRRFMQRDPFPGDGISFLQDIRILIGVHELVRAVASDFPQAQDWLLATLTDPRLRAADRFHELAQAHVRAAIDNQPAQFTYLLDDVTATDLAMMLWMIASGTGRPLGVAEDEDSVRRQTARAVLLANPSDLTVPQAALLLRATQDVIDASIDNMTPRPSAALILTGADGSAAAAQPELSTAGRAFLCYVREDSQAVDRLQRALEAAGIKVWRDIKDLWPGEDWRHRIRHAITHDALAFIACFSKQSTAKAKSRQNDEILLAVDELRERQPHAPWFFPVRLDNCKVPEIDIGGGRTLASIQRTDLFGENYGEGIIRLATTVRSILT